MPSPAHLLPINEPNLTYAPGIPERAVLKLELERQEDRQVDLTATIDGAKRMGSGTEIPVVRPHIHQLETLGYKFTLEPAA